MMRDLRIVVDSNADTCGPCHRREGIRCGVFGVYLRVVPPDDFERVTGCLAAEMAARPWQRTEDDDDPVPHHLRESER
jgi:hypothetical protein